MKLHPIDGTTSCSRNTGYTVTFRAGFGYADPVCMVFRSRHLAERYVKELRLCYGITDAKITEHPPKGQR